MTNEEIARFFNNTRAFIQGNPDLRDPQVEGWFRTRQHFRNSSEHAILQIPAGRLRQNGAPGEDSPDKGLVHRPQKGSLLTSSSSNIPSPCVGRIPVFLWGSA